MKILKAKELELIASEFIGISPLSIIANAAGIDADLHLVGGTLRDIASGLKTADFDLASILPPEAMEARLKSANIRVIETGIEHGTITALVNDIPIEITTFRKPGRRQSSEYSDTITQDLRGRDFSINALAFSFRTQKLIDPYSGLADLQNEIVRAVEDASLRFAEDPLRILRMIRFGPASNREIEIETASAARDAGASLLQVSIERIREELCKIIVSDFPARALICMKDLELLQFTLPEILPTIGFEQNQFHIHDVFEHTLWVLERSEKTQLQRLSALFHDLGKPASLTVDSEGYRHFYKHELRSEEICKAAMLRLKFSHKDIQETALLVKHHMRPLDCGEAGVRRLMRELDSLIEEWLKLKSADAPPKMSEGDFQALKQSFLEKLSAEKLRMHNQYREKLAINGDDLISLGLAEGKELGALLAELQELVLDDPSLNTREYLFDLAKRKLSQNSCT